MSWVNGRSAWLATSIVVVMCLFPQFFVSWIWAEQVWVLVMRVVMYRLSLTVLYGTLLLFHSLIRLLLFTVIPFYSSYALSLFLLLSHCSHFSTLSHISTRLMEGKAKGRKRRIVCSVYPLVGQTERESIWNEESETISLIWLYLSVARWHQGRAHTHSMRFHCRMNTFHLRRRKESLSFSLSSSLIESSDVITSFGHSASIWYTLHCHSVSLFFILLKIFPFGPSFDSL